MKTSSSPYDICVVGGAGHVGLPLALVLAKSGYRTLIHDRNITAMEILAQGVMPFLDEGGEPLLREALDSGMIGFSEHTASIKRIPVIILTIGTPVDEFHNPVLRVLTDAMDDLLPHLDDDQTIILRSTVFPGATDFLCEYVRGRGRKTLISFCPERVVQGCSIRELQSLPQIISGTTPEAEEVAANLFSRIVPKLVRLKPKEAEFAKLFTNAYRYFQFAISNQFYMMATVGGLDYAPILAGMKEDYPRTRDVPGAGFAAGPCLYKDTIQLVAFANNQFALGYAAIQINEGLPAFLIDRLSQLFDLRNTTVGLLGMAFKADSDDARSSLSYKLRKLLLIRARETLCTDPYVKSDASLLPLEEVVARSDVLVLCAPHTEYRPLDFAGKPVMDIWNALPNASRIRMTSRNEAGKRPGSSPPETPSKTKGI